MLGMNKYYINLVRQFAVSGFKLKHQGTVLGFIWTLLNPLLILIILYMLFSKRLGKDIEHYEIYLLIGIIQWNFFSLATQQGLKSIISKREIIHNVPLPRTAVVVGSVMTIFISFLFELIILFAFLLFSGVGFSFKLFLFPLVVLSQLLLIISISLILSCLNVYFRDMVYIWDIFLRIGFFVTPIFYLVPMFISKPKMAFYLLNPMTQLLYFSRDIILFKRIPPLANMGLLFLFVLLLFLLSCRIFQRLQDSIVERV